MQLLPNKVLRYTLLVLFMIPGLLHAELGGVINIEQRYFLQDALYPSQARAQTSFVFTPEWYTSFGEGDHTLIVKPYYRYDQEDSERTHADIRELLWTYVTGEHEFKAGIGKVFWGQTESLHLVDVINQTDLVDAVDNEAKLGQPMLSYSYYLDAGVASVYILPYFRERTFSGRDGRLRPIVPIDSSRATYESPDEESNIDYALRWQQTLGDWEVGLSYFNGTNREPIPITEGSVETNDLAIYPYYELIEQYGLDVLWVNGSWLYKLETIYRESKLNQFYAAVAGFEYTWVGAFDSSHDIGWLVEYQFDERDSNFFAPAQNDIMFGMRWVWNDFDSTEILVGAVQDLDSSSTFSVLVEASTRMTENWRWTMNGYFFGSEDPTNPYYFIRRDDHLEFNVEYFF